MCILLAVVNFKTCKPSKASNQYSPIMQQVLLNQLDDGLLIHSHIGGYQQFPKGYVLVLAEEYVKEYKDNSAREALKCCLQLYKIISWTQNLNLLHSMFFTQRLSPGVTFFYFKANKATSSVLILNSRWLPASYLTFVPRG